MSYDPIWNGIINGINQVLGTVSSKMEKKSDKEESKNLFYNILGDLDKELNPQPETQYTDPTSGRQLSRSEVSNQMGSENAPEQSQVTPEPNINNAMNVLYSGIGELQDYGDAGDQYSNLLGAYYKGNLPDYKIVESKGNIFRVDANKNKMDLLYKGEEKDQELKNIGQTYFTTDKDGNFKVAIDVYDPDNNKYKTEYIRDMSDTEIEQYNKKMELQDATIQQKLRRPKGIKPPKMPEVSTGKEMLLKADIDAYAGLKQKNWDKMSDSEKNQYEDLHQRIADQTGQDPDDLTNYIYSTDMTSKNRPGNYGDVAQERMDMVQEQYTTVGNVFNEVIDAMNNGKMTMEQAKEYALSLYNDNINSWLPEVRKYILETLKEMGIDINTQ